MESRLKERLTGAAILVALIVLLVPEMFRGQRGDVATNASSGEGPPVRSYTIDLSNGPDRTAPLQSTPPAASAAPDTSAATDTAPAVAAVTVPAPEIAPAPAAKPSVAPSTAPTPITKAPSPSAPAHTAGGTWSVQLGLFAQHDNAERLVHSAQSKGFAVVVSERDAKGLYHVEVENLSDRAAAQAMQSRLHEQGLPAAVVPPAARH